MEICETQTFLCDLINVGGANLAAEATHVGEAEIIGDDDQEVRALGSHVNGVISRIVWGEVGGKRGKK